MSETNRPEPTDSGERRHHLVDDGASRAAASARIREQAKWVDLEVEQAIKRGEFDDLPGKGKPIEGLGEHHDPDWWLKKLIEREKIAVLPPALQLRKDDAELDGVLDKLATEQEVRRELETFNERIRRARMQLEGGPPVITAMRDVDADVAAWSERRAERAARARQEAVRPEPAAPRRRWFRRG
jgi:hypothetical protein